MITCEKCKKEELPISCMIQNINHGFLIVNNV